MARFEWQNSGRGGLKKPKIELSPIVQYLGGRGKIYQIHMRHIREGLHNFAEV